MKSLQDLSVHWIFFLPTEEDRYDKQKNTHSHVQNEQLLKKIGNLLFEFVYPGIFPVFRS